VREAATAMYQVCGLCGARDALLKCSCILSQHYCNHECYKGHTRVHRESCSVHLLSRIEKTQKALALAQSSVQPRKKCTHHGNRKAALSEIANLEQTLAVLLHRVGVVMVSSTEPKYYPSAYDHFLAALQLHRKIQVDSSCHARKLVRTTGTTVPVKTAVHGLYATYRELAGVCCLMHMYSDSYEHLQMQLDDIRGEMHGNSGDDLQMHLATTLSDIGKLYQYLYTPSPPPHEHEILFSSERLPLQSAFCVWRWCSRKTHGPGSLLGCSHSNFETLFDGRFYASKAILEESIYTWKSLALMGHTGNTLLCLGNMLSSMRDFPGARIKHQEALAVEKAAFGPASTQAMSCYEKMAAAAYSEGMQLRYEIYDHQATLMSNERFVYQAPGHIARVSGLHSTNKDYNGLEVVVLASNPCAVLVRSYHCHKHSLYLNLVLDRHNVVPAMECPAQVQKKMQRMQALLLTNIKHCRLCSRTQLEIHGPKNLKYVFTVYTLACALLRTHMHADAVEARKLLLQGNTIRERTLDTHPERKEKFRYMLEQADSALLSFEHRGALSAYPCCWPVTTYEEDIVTMQVLFTAIRTRHCPRLAMSSAVVQEELRYYGLIDIVVPESPAVTSAHFVACACRELRDMKTRALATWSSAVPTSV